MAPRGSVRKHNPSIPGHIDQAALPKGVYWDKSGNGRWYVFVQKEGRPARETIAGPNARLSDLHRLVEAKPGGPLHGSVDWMMEAFQDSSRFKEFTDGTQRNYKQDRKVIETFPTKIGIPFGKLVAAKVSQTNVARMHEAIIKQGHPSKANRVLRYLRRVYKWAGPSLGLTVNPARGIEQARERKRRRLPSPAVYQAVVEYARERGARKAHSLGSQPPYLWIIAELGYLCRLRGIETVTLSEAQGEKDGLRTDRRKGSRNNVVKWSPRLRAAWDAALAHRKKTSKNTTNIQQLHAADRFLFLSEDGEPLTKDGLDSAWQRLIKAAIADNVITVEQRFSLHDLKRKGGTDTVGTRAVKQDALGVTEAMMDVYDLSVPLVEPSVST